MMLRRVQLLPARYAQRKRARRQVLGIAIAGAGLVALMVLWWLMLGSSIESEKDELSAVQVRNSQLQAEIAQLQRFAELDAEVQAKRQSLQTVFRGDLNWPSLLTQVAMVIPGEVWLESLNASAGTTEGAASVGTETAAIRISDVTPTGRIQFTGQATTMPSVAEWLIQQEKVDAFTAIWLNSATGGEAGSTFAFDSTLELGPGALSQRYLGDLP